MSLKNEITLKFGETNYHLIATIENLMAIEDELDTSIALMLKDINQGKLTLRYIVACIYHSCEGMDLEAFKGDVVKYGITDISMGIVDYLRIAVDGYYKKPDGKKKPKLSSPTKTELKRFRGTSS